MGSNPTPSANQTASYRWQSNDQAYETWFQIGDHVQLKGPTNPHKGNLKMGKTYQVRGLMRYSSSYRADQIILVAENGIKSHFDCKDFIVKYPGNGSIPSMSGADEYEEIMKMQETME